MLQCVQTIHANLKTIKTMNKTKFSEKYNKEDIYKQKNKRQKEKNIKSIEKI